MKNNKTFDNSRSDKTGLNSVIETMAQNVLC